jgi:transcription initiation factor IIE alpha subunit
MSTEVNNEIDGFIESHIKYIRRMASLTDDQLRALLKMKATESPDILDHFRENKSKKKLDEVSQLAKSIKTPATALGRKVA